MFDTMSTGYCSTRTSVTYFIYIQFAKLFHMKKKHLLLFPKRVNKKHRIYNEMKVFHLYFHVLWALENEYFLHML